VTPEDAGLCRVGWASRAAAYEIGKDKRSFGFGSTGKKSHGGQFLDYGAAFGKARAMLLASLACQLLLRLILKHNTPWRSPSTSRALHQ
jgi:hypothetical protein